MPDSSIDFPCQCGGPDADTVITPTWMALKELSKDFKLRGLTLAELAFILRVDGKVSVYEVVDPVDNLKINRRQGYLSVDIGITHEDRTRIIEKITRCILATPDYIKQQPKAKSLKLDYDLLNESLREFCDIIEAAKISA